VSAKLRNGACGQCSSGPPRRLTLLRSRTSTSGPGNLRYENPLPDRVLDGLSVPKRREFWEERLTSGEITVLVADTHEVVAGWLVYGISRDPDAVPSVAEVYGLYVDPNAWRSATGTALWNEAYRRVAQSPIEQLTLWVFEASSRARRFYEAVGFRHEVGQVKQFVRDGVELDEVRYRFRVVRPNVKAASVNPVS
jgi:L-amino acid N-acyltransferase YncA